MLDYISLNKTKINTNNYLEFNIPQEYKDAITSILNFFIKDYKYKDDIIEIRLFGSCSKQELKWDSDIDILIIVQDQNTFTYSKRYLVPSLIDEKIGYNYGMDCDVVVYTKSQFIDGNMPLTLSIRQNNTLLYKKGG